MNISVTEIPSVPETSFISCHVLLTHTPFLTHMPHLDDLLKLVPTAPQDWSAVKSGVLQCARYSTNSTDARVATWAAYLASIEEEWEQPTTRLSRDVFHGLTVLRNAMPVPPSRSDTFLEAAPAVRVRCLRCFVCELLNALVTHADDHVRGKSEVTVPEG